jgi:hypothetical protein
MDGDTFQMHITWKSPKNKFIYSSQETIRIASIDDSDWYENGNGNGRESDDLEWKLRGKIVKCNVRDRDSYGRLECSIIGVF